MFLAIHSPSATVLLVCSRLQGIAAIEPEPTGFMPRRSLDLWSITGLMLSAHRATAGGIEVQDPLQGRLLRCQGLHASGCPLLLAVGGRSGEDRCCVLPRRFDTQDRTAGRPSKSFQPGMRSRFIRNRQGRTDTRRKVDTAASVQGALHVPRRRAPSPFYSTDGRWQLVEM